MRDILLVEDQEELSGLLSVFLEKAGYTVYRVSSGEEALLYLEDHAIKLLILDIMLPGLDGFAVCTKVREQGSVPVLILSAGTEKSAKLTGFRLGADDYMEKPADPDILTAKVNALIQRSYGVHPENEILVSGGLTIDKNARKVYKDRELIELNVKEYELLLLLAENPGKTLHKDYLFQQIWGADSFSENQTLTVHIKMLRTKIEENPKQPERIKTVWGVGYCYEEV